MSQPIVKIFFSSGCYSALIGCPNTREAVLVDPKVGLEAQYRYLLVQYDLALSKVLDTHTHADHVSAAPALMAEGVELFMSHATGCERPNTALRDEDEFKVGNLSFRVLELPGHTPDSIALHGHGMLIAGDSLFAGGLARADFRGSDPELLFDSVKNKVMCLPDETLVFPGHNYRDIIFTTVGQERATNPALQYTSGAEYAESLGATIGAGNSSAVDAMLALNLQADPELPKEAGNAATCCASGSATTSTSTAREMTPEEVRDLLPELVETGRWIDVRDPFEFDLGCVPGTRSLPLSELGFNLDELSGRDPLFFSCRTGVRSLMAARTLEHLGIVHNPVSIAGGILRWQRLGYPLNGGPLR